MCQSVSEVDEVRQGQVFASPLVVWEGSHRLVADAFRGVLADIPPAEWSDVDLTDTYQAVRRRVFDRCRRVAVHARPGQAYLVHRHALHGISPWQPGATAPPEGRVVAYFRPEWPQPGHWLADD